MGRIRRVGQVSANPDSRSPLFPFCSTIPAPHRKQWAVRTCVIFNPMARGEKARRFRRHLDDIGAESALKQTAAPGEARRLAAEPVEGGFEVGGAAGRLRA